MSFQAYDKQVSQMGSICSKYTTGLNETGICSSQGYNVFPDPVPTYLLQSSQDQSGNVPSYMNPAAMLYSHGAQGQLLQASASAKCDKGCLGSKVDPRGNAKSTYTASSFVGTNLPTIYNSTGMYP